MQLELHFTIIGVFSMSLFVIILCRLLRESSAIKISSIFLWSYLIFQRAVFTYSVCCFVDIGSFIGLENVIVGMVNCYMIKWYLFTYSFIGCYEVVFFTINIPSSPFISSMISSLKGAAYDILFDLCFC